MIEHIISKMVLDRTCPICNGMKRFKKSDRDLIDCSNCSGRGYTSDVRNMSALLVEDLRIVPLGIVMSMKQQNMLVVDEARVEKLRGYCIRRLYVYNVDVNSYLFKFANWRQKWCTEPTEIHIYFDRN